ncbi:MAG: type I polyketide synthase, partial [Streptosporangiaceae bacterium]
MSSFGISGTNAHLILEHLPEAHVPVPVPLSDTGTGAGTVPWVISARDGQALRAQAAALVGASVGAAPADLGWSLLTTRSALDHRAVVVGEGRAEWDAALEALAAGDPHPAVAGPGTTVPGRIVWLFSGQGSQRVGMGADLYVRFPVFAAAFDEVCDHLDEFLDDHLEHPLGEVVFTGDKDLLDHTTYAQAGLFALQVALARLLGSAGIRPDVVIGHSLGEIAAAHVAGVFDLPDACRLVAARAGLMGGLPTGGAMTAIQATAEELADDLARHDGRVVVAALNTPDSTVISGPADLVAELGARWAGRDRKIKSLAVSHAFHSPLMDPVLGDFTEAISEISYHPPVIPLISNLTGLPADESIATPGYWAEHIRRPVLFHPAVTHAAPGTRAFLELGPDPVLATATQRTLDADAPLVLSALNGRQPEIQAFTHALARLHTAGVPVDWTAWFPAAQVVDLPTYAFQRERYWLDGGTGGTDAAGLGLLPAGHPLLGAAVELADGGTRVLTGRLSRQTGAWLAEHLVAGTALLPGAALVDWALRAADEVGACVEELTLQAPFVLPESGAVRVQVATGAADPDGRREVRIHSRPDQGSDEWTCHAEGVLRPEPAGPAGDRLDGPWPPPGAEPVDVSGFYELAAAGGYEYGPAFQGLQAVWRDGPDLLAEVSLPETAGDPGGYGVHPALLDAALHPIFLTGRFDGARDQRRLWLPFAWGGVSLSAGGSTALRVRLSPQGPAAAAGERALRVTLTDPAGAPVLSIDTLHLRETSEQQLRAARQREVRGLFTLDWTPLPDLPQQHQATGWVELGATGGEDLAHYADLEALVRAIEAGEPAPPVALTEIRTGSQAMDVAGLAATEQALTLVRAWLSEPELAGTRLVLLTRDPTGAAVAGAWGLVRSAQSENPGRFTLLALQDGTGGVVNAVRAVLDQDEPQAAVRGGVVLVPRLVRT